MPINFENISTTCLPHDAVLLFLICSPLAGDLSADFLRSQSSHQPRSRRDSDLMGMFLGFSRVSGPEHAPTPETSMARSGVAFTARVATGQEDL
jgi:hypothetical protein